MRYEHHFLVNAPVEAVADFHTRSSSLKAITPFLFLMRVHHAPARLKEGDVMAFTMWIGMIPILWITRIEGESPHGFVDSQLKGPFKKWQHLHTFRPRDQHTTEVIDEIEAELQLHPWWGPIGASMWAGLPALFTYRQQRTRSLLGRSVKHDA